MNRQIFRLVAMLAPLCLLSPSVLAQPSSGMVSADPSPGTSLTTDGTILLAQARPGAGFRRPMPRPSMSRPAFNRPNASRPGIGRPVTRPFPTPSFNRPNRPPRPGINQPARPGGVGTGAVVRPDGSSVIIRPPVGNRPKPPGIRPPGVRPPALRPPGWRPSWRPWRPGLGWVILTAPPSYAIAQNLNWCHVHRYAVPGMRFHRDVRCHQHADWNHPSIRYVYGD